MTRADHLEFAKKRALAYVERGDLEQAWSSLASDFKNHEELENHSALQFGFKLMMGGFLGTKDAMRKFIEGCW